MPSLRDALAGAGQQPTVSTSQAWQEKLGQLQNQSGSFGPAAQLELRRLSKDTEALMDYRANLHPEEFEKLMGDVQSRADRFKWQDHVRPPGSNPGDIIEDNGIRKIRTAEGGFEPVAFTSDYVRDHTVELGSSGNVAVPVSPKEGYKVVSAKARDLAIESAEIDKTEQGISKIFDQIKDRRQQEKVVLDDDGNEIGFEGFTSDEINSMNIEAGNAYLRSRMQAKNIARTLADSGAGPMQQAIGGDVADPFKLEKKQKQLLERKVLQESAQRQAAKDLLEEQRGPTPSPSPVPGGQTIGKSLDGEEFDARTLEQLAEFDRQEKAEKMYSQATVNPSASLGSRLIEAGSMRGALSASTKEDMNLKYADAPEGATVELANGKRYMKEKGQFIAVPWNKKQIASDVMLDAQGKPIIDPNTGEAVPGIVEQFQGSAAEEIATSPEIDPSTGREIVDAELIGVSGPIHEVTKVNEDGTVEFADRGGKVISNQFANKKQLEEGSKTVGDRPPVSDPQSVQEAAAKVSSLKRPADHQPPLATQELEQQAVYERGTKQELAQRSQSSRARRVLQAYSQHPHLVDAINNAPVYNRQQMLEAETEVPFLYRGRIAIKMPDGSYESYSTSEWNEIMRERNKPTAADASRVLRDNNIL